VAEAVVLNDVKEAN